MIEKTSKRRIQSGVCKGCLQRLFADAGQEVYQLKKGDCILQDFKFFGRTLVVRTVWMLTKVRKLFSIHQKIRPQFQDYFSILTKVNSILFFL
jgi:hypothetical protein